MEYDILYTVYNIPCDLLKGDGFRMQVKYPITPNLDSRCTIVYMLSHNYIRKISDFRTKKAQFIKKKLTQGFFFLSYSKHCQ